MEYTYSQFIKRGHTDSEVSWCLLHGPEESLKEQVLQDLLGQLLSEEAAEFNLDFLEGEEASADQILGLAQTVPFLSDRRVVVIRRAEDLGKEEQAKLAESLDRVGRQACVVLVTGESDQQRRTGPQRALSRPLQQAIARQGMAIGFSPPKSEEAIAWATSQVKSLGKGIERTAAARLVHQVGPHLSQLKQEIEKLVLYIGDRETVTRNDVDQVVPTLPEEDVFRLLDAVGRKQPSRAMAILHHLLRERSESPVWMLTMLARQICLIWQAKLLQDKGWKPGQETPAEAASLLPQGHNALSEFERRPWLARRCLGQADNFTWEQLEAALDRLQACDLSLKGASGMGSPSQGLALELLVIELCTGLQAHKAKTREK